MLANVFDITSCFRLSPPWGGRPCLLYRPYGRLPISIHALRGEGDYLARQHGAFRCGFQSTPSVGRATISLLSYPSKRGISIHALRGEGDPPSRRGSAQARHFNPRPPWGGRRVDEIIANKRAEISIHALRGEGDTLSAVDYVTRCLFQSTPSVGRATPCPLPSTR